jgi:hypothetical protein
MSMNRFRPLTFALALLINLSGAVIARSADSPPTVVGVWQGRLGPGGALRVLFHISRNNEGVLAATLDSPDQGATGIPTDTVRVTSDTLYIAVNAIGGSYQGVLKAAGRITGTWSQMGARMPLNLERIEKAPEKPARPQEPKRPLPYEEEDVTYTNEADGVTLAGTLTRPAGDGPFPCVLFITGSGPQDRDETILGHKPFFVLSDHLTRLGVATLRVDDRGVGQSTGSTPNSTTEDFAGDVLAGIDYLKMRPEIDGSRIGLIGHSEGAMVGPLAASQSDAVAFMVLLAPPGVPGREIVLTQNAALLKSIGASGAFIENNRRVTDQVLQMLAAHDDVEQIEIEVRALHDREWAGLPDELKKEHQELGMPEPSKALDAVLETMTTPWYRSFLRSDPASVLTGVSCPVLAVIGSKDLQVAPDVNLHAVEGALRSGGNEEVTTARLEGLNHLFQTAETGSVMEYGKIEETFSPEAMRVISSWILTQIK